MEERNYKLYVHISPSGKRYYGITCQEPENRWGNNGKGYINNVYFTRAINKYGWDNFQHIVLFNNLSKEEVCLLEQMYIALYDTTNSKYGYNNRLGGEHGLHSDKSKKKMSESRKGNIPWNKDKQLSEEHKRKLSESHKGQVSGRKGKTHTMEAREKLSKAHKGQVAWNKGKTDVYSKETKKKMSEARKGKYKGKDSAVAKPILMFTLDEEFIRRFDCIAEAAQYLGRTNGGSNISACARGKLNTMYGYKWKFEE